MSRPSKAELVNVLYGWKDGKVDWDVAIAAIRRFELSVARSIAPPDEARQARQMRHVVMGLNNLYWLGQQNQLWKTARTKNPYLLCYPDCGDNCSCGEQ